MPGMCCAPCLVKTNTTNPYNPRSTNPTHPYTQHQPASLESNLQVTATLHYTAIHLSKTLKTLKPPTCSIARSCCTASPSLLLTLQLNNLGLGGPQPQQQRLPRSSPLLAHVGLCAVQPALSRSHDRGYSRACLSCYGMVYPV